LSINYSDQYEDEVLRVIEDYKMNNLKIFIGKFMFAIVRKIGDKKNSFLLILKLIIQLFLKRINNYPSVVYYDFKDSFWKK